MLARRAPEDGHLDYKRRDSLLGNSNKRGDEVSKDVSAFMNSDGGALVYGVRDSKASDKVGGVPEPFDPRIDGYEQGEITREQIEDIVTGNTQPKPGPDLFRVIEAQLSGRLVFVVDIAKSMQGAFQAKDKKYYRRFNFKSEPMDHWEIEDVRNRAVGPDLQLVYGFTDTWEQEATYSRGSRIPIHLGLQNIGRGLAETALLELGIFKREYSGSPPPSTFDARTRLVTLQTPISSVDRSVSGQRKVPFCWFHLPWTQQARGLGYMPLFAMVDPSYATVIELVPPDASEIQGYMGHIVWRLQAPQMSPKQGLLGIYKDFSDLRLHQVDHRLVDISL